MSKEIASKIIFENKSLEITFIEETHTYFVNGKKLPSVTQIMEEVSNEYYIGIDEKTLQNASKRGLRVHKAVELYEKLGLEPIDDEIRPYLLQYKVAKKLEGFQVIEIEKRLTNNIYCGTIDIIGLLNDEIIIIDEKATSVINNRLLQIQLAGYILLLKSYGVNVSKGYVLHLKKNGYKFKPIDVDFNYWNLLVDKWYKNNTIPKLS